MQTNKDQLDVTTLLDRSLYPQLKISRFYVGELISCKPKRSRLCPGKADLAAFEVSKLVPSIFRMLDMGFMPDVNRCENNFTMPKKGQRQTLMFSATFPAEVQTTAKR